MLVDAGDMFQGTLESNLGEGAAVVRAYNLLGYDAAAVGNHEFDFGPVGPAPTPRAPGDDRARRAQGARRRGAVSRSSPPTWPTPRPGAPPPWPNVRPHDASSQVAGVKVGIIGMTTMATPRTTMAANFAGLAVKPLAPDRRRGGAGSCAARARRW